MTPEEVKAKFTEIVEECQYDSGHGGYTGTLAEKDSYPLNFIDETFPNADAAYECLSNNNDKWGAADAIRYTDADGKEWWLVGGWCSS